MAFIFPNPLPALGQGFMNPDGRAWLGQLLGACRGLLGAKAPEAVTIAAGLATLTAATCTLDTEGGAASDDLDRVDPTGWAPGALVRVRCADANRKIRARPLQGASGQLRLATAANLTLDDTSMFLELELEASGAVWREVRREFGANKGQARDWLGVHDAATLGFASAADVQDRTREDRHLMPANLATAFDHYPLVMGDRIAADHYHGGGELVVALPDGQGDLYLRKVLLRDLFAGFLKDPWVSDPLPCGAGVGGVHAHGLGDVPRLLEVRLRNTTAQHGYGPGDEVQLAAADGTRALTVGCNAGDVFYRVGAQNLAIVTAGNTVAVINPDYWALVIRAFL